MGGQLSEVATMWDLGTELKSPGLEASASLCGTISLAPVLFSSQGSESSLQRRAQRKGLCGDRVTLLEADSGGMQRPLGTDGEPGR